MRLTPLVLLPLTLTIPGFAAAQDLGGYMTVGPGSTDYIVVREPTAQVSGGVLVRVVEDRVRVGVQGDLLWSGGYFSGRGGPFIELPLLARRRIQPFVGGGLLVADGGVMGMLGGGVDVWVREKVGIRIAVQDAFRAMSVYSDLGSAVRHTVHEPSFQAGIVWR